MAAHGLNLSTLSHEARSHYFLLVEFLRSKGMSDATIGVWLQSPHKVLGMQVPVVLISSGRGSEIVRAYGLDQVDQL